MQRRGQLNFADPILFGEGNWMSALQKLISEKNSSRSWYAITALLDFLLVYRSAEIL